MAADVWSVWQCVTHPDGINDELRPWRTMSMPRGAAGMTMETAPVGRPLGRAWLRLFGVVPFDFDHLTLVVVEPGVRFHERSTMLSLRRWEHVRTLSVTVGGTRVHDRITLQPRLPAPGTSWLLARVVDALLRHRHRRLRARFGAVRAAGAGR